MVEIDQISSVLDWKTFFVLSEESASFILNEIEIEQPPPNFRQVQEIFGIFQIQSRWNWLLYSTKITRILSPADAWTIASSVLIWKTDSFFGFRHRKKTSIFFILHESKMKEKTEMVCHERWEISSERKKRLRSVLLRIFSSPNHRFFFRFFLKSSRATELSWTIASSDMIVFSVRHEWKDFYSTDAERRLLGIAAIWKTISMMAAKKKHSRSFQMAVTVRQLA